MTIPSSRKVRVRGERNGCRTKDDTGLPPKSPETERIEPRVVNRLRGDPDLPALSATRRRPGTTARPDGQRAAVGRSLGNQVERRAALRPGSAQGRSGSAA